LSRSRSGYQRQQHCRNKWYLMQTIHGVTSMSMSHAAILPNCDAFTRRAQLRMTLCLVRAGFQATRGLLVRFGHLPMTGNIFGSVPINLRGCRRSAFAGRCGRLRQSNR
jgi:hypothetical protein